MKNLIYLFCLINLTACYNSTAPQTFKTLNAGDSIKVYFGSYDWYGNKKGIDTLLLSVNLENNDSIKIYYYYKKNGLTNEWKHYQEVHFLNDTSGKVLPSLIVHLYYVDTNKIQIGNKSYVTYRLENKEEIVDGAGYDVISPDYGLLFSQSFSWGGTYMFEGSNNQLNDTLIQKIITSNFIHWGNKRIKHALTKNKAH